MTTTPAQLAKVEDIGARVLRTIVQTGIPTFIGFAAVLPSILAALGFPAGSKVELALLAFSAVVTAIAGALTRVMAIPAVNIALGKIGIGAKTSTVTPVVTPTSVDLNSTTTTTVPPAETPDPQTSTTL